MDIHDLVCWDQRLTWLGFSGGTTDVRYTVVVIVDTERTPQNLIREVVSNLEFEPATKTTVSSVIALTEGGTDVAVYGCHASGPERSDS